MAQTQDALLNVLIALAENEFSIESPITINVHGVIVEGTIIPRRKYVKALFEGMRNARHLTLDDKLAPGDMSDVLTKAIDATLPSADAAKQDGSCMYLRNVKILNVTKLVDFQSVWCIRRDSIGAWAAGHTLSKQSQ
ncbi:hypothetical protein [Sorangium sp. So ce513]|uniref:hypothetical protein n=1 Tax=Sorangium sp. So ce513 TaxID=3133315 RepID=UPI003F632873